MFESANKLLLKVPALLTHDEVCAARGGVRAERDEVLATHEAVRDIGGRFDALKLEVHSSVVSAAGMEDCWICGNRSLPSKEPFMLGADKLGCVASLKTAVLDRNVGGVVAAVGVQGMGGVGETTACLVVASDQEVLSACSDARLWMSLGLDVTTEAVVDRLAGVVEKTGGALSAKLMRDTFKKNGTGKLDSIKDQARQWLHVRHVLLVLDNVFLASSDSSPRHWVQFLKHVLGCDSCLLFSTRAVEGTVESNKLIPFEPLESEMQQAHVLFAHLGGTEAALESCQVETQLNVLLRPTHCAGNCGCARPPLELRRLAVDRRNRKRGHLEPGQYQLQNRTEILCAWRAWWPCGGPFCWATCPRKQQRQCIRTTAGGTCTFPLHSSTSQRPVCRCGCLPSSGTPLRPWLSGFALGFRTWYWVS
jgi:hypothetical protein